MTPPLRRASNLAVARLFEEIAQSLEVAGEQGHRLRAYRRAAHGVAAESEPLEELAATGRLRQIAGVGASLEALIAEFLSTGGIRTHARLVGDNPPGLAPLLRARGFGPASVQALHAALGATDLDAVERAAEEGRLAEVLGQRRAADLIAQLPSLRNPIRTLRLKSAWESAAAFLELLRDPSVAPRQIEVAGAARRMCESVVGGVDLVAIPGQAGGAATSLLDLLERLPSVEQVIGRDATSTRVRVHNGVEVRLQLAEPETWGAALLLRTGSDAHLARLRTLAEARGYRLTPAGLFSDDRLVASATEENVYAALGLPWIAPELREDQGEIEAGLAGNLPRLIGVDDLRGDLHCHTNWTDGTASLGDMAAAARARGYQYMALTDHSRSLTITNGLSLERLEEARRLVQRVNEELAPFVVLLGTEMDILLDGSLDYPDETLATLDYVSASVHSGFKQPASEITPRIVRAVEHPLVHTLNHPHGRMLGARPAYAVDMPAVIAAATAAGCALEVSADPARMDLDGGWARQVRAAGGCCTVSSDAHSTLDFDNIWLGIGSARRGWLEPRDVLNTRSLDEFRAHLQRRRRG
ncbi:MAG TPA: PHP domain-containing protein [Chloroflexota bacterium]|nr:PHP domain-containing protein [Chloroflexota bacterium]